MKTYLGIELGSTRIKAVAIDENFKIISKGEYGWKSDYVDGIWTYSLDEAWLGVKSALKAVAKDVDLSTVSVAGISGMMHGYLAFDKDWNLLAPFATWQNTVTADAAKILSDKFNLNIPQRWSVAHLYQRVLNGEKHVKDVAHITTLAGYIHFMLTGENAIGIGEASGMFPVNADSKAYDERSVAIFNNLLKDKGIEKDVISLLPQIKVAGQNAGNLKNARLIDNLLPCGLPFAPCEGDMQTGMVATNSVSKYSGNVSAGTCLNLTVITDRAFSKIYPEIDVILTPDGVQAAMVHTNNCTNDINAWFSVLGETAMLFGGNCDDLYTKLYELSLKGDADCGGIVAYNYLAGEGITHINDGKPIIVRKPDAKFTLANFIRAQLYGALATLRLGIDIFERENVKITKITGHGGFFKTPEVGQRYLAAACRTSIYCNSSAGEGGPYGMALLAAFSVDGKGASLEKFLEKAFSGVDGITVEPDAASEEGFNGYMRTFVNGLEMQKVKI